MLLSKIFPGNLKAVVLGTTGGFMSGLQGAGLNRINVISNGLSGWNQLMPGPPVDQDECWILTNSYSGTSNLLTMYDKPLVCPGGTVVAGDGIYLDKAHTLYGFRFFTAWDQWRMV